jgi:hypothetical protein
MSRGGDTKDVSRPAEKAGTVSRQTGQTGLLVGISLEQLRHFGTAGTLLQSRSRMANVNRVLRLRYRLAEVLRLLFDAVSAPL